MSSKRVSNPINTFCKTDETHVGRYSDNPIGWFGFAPTLPSREWLDPPGTRCERLLIVLGESSRQMAKRWRWRPPPFFNQGPSLWTNGLFRASLKPSVYPCPRNVHQSPQRSVLSPANACVLILSLGAGPSVLGSYTCGEDVWSHQYEDQGRPHCLTMLLR